jgi:hypothetical protein
MLSRTVLSSMLGLAMLGSLLSAPARGQVPQPRVADINDRSGLITRFLPIDPTLPEDSHRQKFYDTRWAHYPEVTHPNCYRHGGLYGLRWSGDCTSCSYPYFYGSPGANTLGPDCRPRSRVLSRWVLNYFQPFKPVGSYYAGGCYVPIYDLDPVVPGPGPFPWSHYVTNPFRG